MTIYEHHYTSCGGRPQNEDAVDFRVEDDRACYVVTDGESSCFCGAIAAQGIVKSILGSLDIISDLSNGTIASIVSSVNTRVRTVQKRNPKYNDMTTTLTAAYCIGSRMKFFNVGDTRLYYFRNGKILAKTTDHSEAQNAVEIGRIHPDEIRFNEDRGFLTNTIGKKEDIELTRFYDEIEMCNNDAFLLATDGFWENIHENEMIFDLLKSDTPEDWSDFMIKRILRRVEGTNDNLTVLCAMIQE